MLLSLTGDATHVSEWANHTFAVIPSLNTIEEHERYLSSIAHPSGTLGPIGGIGEEVIIVTFGEKGH